jgi:hypothetical protein
MTLGFEINSNSKTNWRLVVDKHIIPALEHFNYDQGITPTLRTLFYRLVSLEVIANTENSYKRLSRILVQERKEGRIEFDAIADESGRQVICNFNDSYTHPEEYVMQYTQYLKRVPLHYRIPRWYKQPHYVEVWIEKQALASTFESFLKGRDVRIVINKGFASWTFLHQNAQRLAQISKEDPGREIHILYFGDFDPSGEDMDRHLNEALIQFDLYGLLEFERIAVTEKQIQEFNLPPTPEDTETLEKLGRDSRTNGFIDKYGKLFAVELDALLAIVPDEFRNLVQESVDCYFDFDIYKDECNRYSQAQMRRLVAQQVKTAFNIPDSVDLDVISDSMKAWGEED